jgi:hypothetical protein
MLSSAVHHVVPQVPKPARQHVRIGLPMIRHSIDGLLFFETGPEVRIRAYDVSQTSALVHADGLGLFRNASS